MPHLVSPQLGSDLGSSERSKGMEEHRRRSKHRLGAGSLRAIFGVQKRPKNSTRKKVISSKKLNFTLKNQNFAQNEETLAGTYVPASPAVRNFSLGNSRRRSKERLGEEQDEEEARLPHV